MGENPSIAMARRLLGEGQAAKAVQTLRSALRRAPQDADLNYNAAGILLESGKPAEAEFFAERAVSLLPTRGLFHGLLGEVLSHLGRFPQAEKAFRKAIALDAKLYSARQNLASIRVMAFDYEEAERLLREAASLRPERAEAPINLANVLVETGRSAEARQVAEACVAQHPHNPMAAACLANLLNYAAGVGRSEVAAAHARFGAIVTRGSAVLPPPSNVRDLHRKLRVAFVSADFKEHSVAYFIEPVLRHLPRDRVEVVAFSRVIKPDTMTARLKAACDEWVDVKDATDAEVAARIRAAGIDVAVELSGLTQGNSLAAFAMKPAPVQLSYLGYPNTAGLAAIRGRLVDSITDPSGEPALVSGEETYRLDPVFLCYRSSAQIRGEIWPPVAPAREAGPLTFASFNVVSKINEPVGDVWAKVLHAEPDSRLLLKARSLSSPVVRDRLFGWFKDRGIEAGRIEMLAYVPTHADHLALYRRVDVGLDPFPYAGTTTTCEALSMGVPVVTLRGKAHAGRVGASILSCVGLADLVADSTDRYVEIASALVRDRNRLAILRGSLRETLAASPLGDGPAIGERMERAIRSAWSGWCASRA